VPDATGFEAFYRENLARIVRACALVTLDPSLAEDMAAEAFARLWSRWGQIRGPDHAGGYVFKTAMRLCARELSRRDRGPALELVWGDDDGTASRLDLLNALSGLPVRQRQTVVLRDWAGYETREVARMLRMRESTVRVHLARARHRLRQALLVEDRER
jgi:DNA-directed RNA polymerase specialized sigma24 family protein